MLIDSDYMSVTQNESEPKFISKLCKFVVKNPKRESVIRRK